MNRARISAGLAGRIALVAVVAAVAALVLGGSTLATAEKTTIKGLMGQNFAGLQTILISLITANYREVPNQANAIHEHASELTGMVPDDIPSTERQRFLSYAYNLDAHARDMKSIAELLIEHDKVRDQMNLGTDQLREALAAHYGGMVTMCVACHNRFRQKVIQ